MERALAQVHLYSDVLHEQASYVAEVTLPVETYLQKSAEELTSEVSNGPEGVKHHLRVQSLVAVARIELGYEPLALKVPERLPEREPR